MKKIAIVKLLGTYKPDISGYSYDSYHEYSQIIANCTEFEEVSDEDYEILKEAFRRKNMSEVSYLVIEHVPRAEILKTVSDFKKALVKQQEDLERMEQERLLKKADATARKSMTSKEKKLKQLAKLQAELGIKP